jgi:hypothetical protein
MDTQKKSNFSHLLRSWLFVLIIFYGFFGCNKYIDPNSNSGGDHQRNMAKMIPLNAVITDDVDYSAGDAIDWKYFDTTGAGIISLTTHFDDPKAIIVVGVFDQYGDNIGLIKHKGEPQQNRTLKVKSSRYYIKIEAKEMTTRSGYGLEVKFDEDF